MAACGTVLQVDRFYIESGDASFADAADTLDAADAAQVPKADAGNCAAGSTRCAGKTPQTCDLRGTWRDGAACPNLCLQGDCVGECAPGSKRCEGGQPHTCDASGHWQTAAPCAAAGLRCVYGDCVSPPHVPKVVAGAYHACTAVPRSAVERVSCWGANDSGQLGNNSNAASAVPVSVLLPGVDVAGVTAGWLHSCALTLAGGALCWGYNMTGQLGNGETTGSTVPVGVSGLATDVIDVTAGMHHSCALTSAGGVRCWGSNYQGQLGNSATGDSSAPVNVAGLAEGVLDLAAGWLFTCALNASHGLKCWGANHNGQLGNGATGMSGEPVDVSGLTSGVKSISAGYAHACALTLSGGVKCWGLNDRGQLGIGDADESHAPVDVLGLSVGVTAVAAGNNHTCAILSGGTVRCWGENDCGALGDGTKTASNVPVNALQAPAGVVEIALGGDQGGTPNLGYTCALTASGKIWCWGCGSVGQLGSGTTANSLTAVEVVGY
jgi:alpha-tubulin suppressor-like RCC1 family protein